MTAQNDEAAIRELVDTLAQAIRARDVDAAMSVFVPEVVSFDLGPPLQHGGGEVFRQRWDALFKAYSGPIGYEVHALDIAVGDGVAFSRSLNRTRGTTAGGRAVDRWVRWTAGYRRVDGQWRIVHEHVSVPADLHSGRAVLDLTP